MRTRASRRVPVRATLAAAVLATMLVPTAAYAVEDPRVDSARQLLAELEPLVSRPVCDQVPDPTRWTNEAMPDIGMSDAQISAHRGAPRLAPENTIDSYEYAFAFGVEYVEVDVQQTKDGRFVALHDSTVDRTTDGTGNISDLTYDEVRALNAADYEPWRGTEFDPAQIASLEEVLALAARVDGGLELDIKGSVTAEDELAELVGRYGLIEESIFNSADPRILVAEPGARLIYNRDRWEPPVLMNEIARVFTVFGSRLDEYDVASINAIHDACGMVMPHAYDAGPDQEVAQFLAGRAMGIDGVQTNQPDLIVAAAGEVVPTRIDVAHGTGGALDQVCLVDSVHGLGFPQQTVTVSKGTGQMALALTTGRKGCVDVPAVHLRGGTVSFEANGALTASQARLIP